MEVLSWSTRHHNNQIVPPLTIGLEHTEWVEERERDSLVEVEIEVEIDTKIGEGVWASFPVLKSSFLNFAPFFSLS